jgi:hypothetical protein
LNGKSAQIKLKKKTQNKKKKSLNFLKKSMKKAHFGTYSKKRFFETLKTDYDLN